MLLLSELIIFIVPWWTAQAEAASPARKLTAPEQLGAGLLLTHLTVLLYPHTSRVRLAVPLSLGTCPCALVPVALSLWPCPCALVSVALSLCPCPRRMVAAGCWP